ncbi:hypothetical protein Tco_1459616, partial [Tanacetum coccineum]
MEKGFLSPKGRGRWNGVKEKIKNVADIPVANKEYNDDFVKGNSVTGPSCIDMNVDQNSLNSSTDTLGDTFGTPNEERADIVGKESEGLNSSPTGIASSPFVSFTTLAKDDGLSVIATKLVIPLRYVRLKDTIVVLVPKFFGDGYIVSTIYVEYEWATPRCSSCHVFVMPLEWKCVLVDDDGKPLEKEYATKSLFEQWRKTYVDDDYDPHDDDMYEGQEISNNIQSICNNLDIK